MGLGSPTGEPVPAKQLFFSPQKGLYYRHEYASVSSAVRVAVPACDEARCGLPGLAWLHVACGCVTGWSYCQILYDVGGVYGREINIRLSGNSFGGHSCS